MITLSIDVTKLDKARFKAVTKQNGDKATYCDLVLFETPTSDYGDYIVKQQVTKEERQARKEMPILGNGKNWQQGQRQAPAPETAEKPESGKSDDVPF